MAEEYPDVLPGALTHDEKLWGMLCHLSALLAYFAFALSFLGPLICWLIKRDTSAFVDDQGKEALNFQLNILLYKLICVALLCAFVGFFLLGAVVVYNVVMVLVAGVKANAGERFRYPLIIRFIG